MKLLVACEYSGVVRDAFSLKGWDAWSCDLLPTESELTKKEGKHIQGDVLSLLDQDWDLMIAHPPCTHLSVSGQHWFTRGLKDVRLREDALDFVKRLLSANIPHIALENPVSIISSHIRKPDQVMQPYQFGDDASKKTCLWLKDLPRLRPTNIIQPRIVDGKQRWGNQSDDGQVNTRDADGKIMGWSNPETAKIRSKTYSGIAQAMAEQWTKYLTKTP